MSLHRPRAAGQAVVSKSGNSKHEAQQTILPLPSRAKPKGSLSTKYSAAGANPPSKRSRLPPPPSTAPRWPLADIKMEESETKTDIDIATSSGPPTARSTVNATSSRLKLMTSTRPSPSPNTTANTSRIPLPSSQSIRDVADTDNARRVLRRKAPSVEQYVSSLGRSTPNLSSKSHPDDLPPNTTSTSLKGQARQQQPEQPPAVMSPDLDNFNMGAESRSAELPPGLIPELQALAAATTMNRTALSTPTVPSVSSPSTQYSGSAGPWSSRDTTPTSVSSYSPSIVQSSRAKSVSRLRREISPSTTTQQAARSLQSGMISNFKSRAPLLHNPIKTDVEVPMLPEKAPKGQNAPTQTSQTGSLPRSTSVYSHTARQPRNLPLSAMEEVVPRVPPKWANSTPSLEQGFSIDSDGDELSLRGRPDRPSRSGTDDLEASFSPVVQSNLSPQITQSYRRRESVGAAKLAADKLDRTDGRDLRAGTRDDVPSRSKNHQRPAVPTHSPGKLRKSPSQPRPQYTSRAHPPSKAKDSRQGAIDSDRTVSEKPSSRWGIFGRRLKTHVEDQDTKENRDSKKGPVAGTGHEGYGKYAKRGRKYSIGSTASSRDRSTSTNTTTSRPGMVRRGSESSGADSDAEEFVAQRLQPVVIKGGGAELSRQSDAPTVWPSFRRTSLGSDSSLDLSRTSTNEPPNSTASAPPSLAAASTGINASLLSANNASFTSSVTPADYIQAIQGPGSLDGYNTSQSSLTQDDYSVTERARDLGRPTVRDMKQAGKKGRMFRWNLFQRNNATQSSPKKVEARRSKSMRLSVAVAPTAVERPVPYYAMMDSEPESEADTALHDLLEQAHKSSSFIYEAEIEPQGLGLRKRYGESILLPSLPILKQKGSSDFLPASGRLNPEPERDPTKTDDFVSKRRANGKANRLPQVGRIPRVISRRDRQHVPAVTSFSRPFHGDHPTNSPVKSRNNAASREEETRPILGIQTDLLPSQPFPQPESTHLASAPSVRPFAMPMGDFDAYRQCFVFPGADLNADRTNTGSEKAEMSYFMPRKLHHRHPNQEDEVWNEFDDFIDDVMSPASEDMAHSTTLLPLESGSEGKRSRIGAVRPDSQLRLGKLHRNNRPTAQNHQQTSLQLPPSHLHPEGDPEYRLRRSRIVSALQAHSPMTPASPFSIGDYVRGYDERNTREWDSPPGFINTHSHKISTTSSLGPNHPQSAALLDIAERNHEGPSGQSDLRFAALMTSRWLSFGRVLFSPAHEAVESTPGQQILVIDGLENDDWSFYCAVTYPQAVVHHLKESSSGSAGQKGAPEDAWRAPSNYKKVEVRSLRGKYPFPSSYFAGVVFRFPAAMSDAALRAAFTECKRVLAPGGYIEISLLDLDIVNMGPITRHAIRDLKTRMMGADPDVGLKPISDNIQNILGQKGFENLNRCMVGVPVVGTVAMSSGSRSSRSSRDSYSRRGTGDQATARSTSRSKRRSVDAENQGQRPGNFSLNDLVMDNSGTSDAKILKMVAKVGRWWYTRTYEWNVLPGGQLTKSIWKDKRMLHECKARGSGFKLLIAYAQKPVETRRRTMSEPSRPTAAISGGPTAEYTSKLRHYETKRYA